MKSALLQGWLTCWSSVVPRFFPLREAIMNLHTLQYAQGGRARDKTMAKMYMYSAFFIHTLSQSECNCISHSNLPRWLPLSHHVGNAALHAQFAHLHSTLVVKHISHPTPTHLPTSTPAHYTHTHTHTHTISTVHVNSVHVNSLHTLQTGTTQFQLF